MVNLIAQTRQHGCLPSGVAGHLDGPDFERAGVNAQVHLAPLRAVVGAVFLGT